MVSHDLVDRQLRILIIEDNPGDLFLMRELISNGSNDIFYVESTSRLREAMDKLRNQSFDVVLLDLYLPDSSSGIETFYTFMREFPQMSVIIMTGLNDQGLATNAVRAGAQDYFLKSDLLHSNGESFIRCIRYAYERGRYRQDARIGVPKPPDDESLDKAKQELSDIVERLYGYGNGE